MSSGSTSFSQALKSYAEELLKRIIEEHERALKRKLAVVLQENADFRKQLGLPQDEDEALELVDLQSGDTHNIDESQFIDHSPTASSSPNGFSLGCAGPSSNSQEAKKDKAPQPPLRSALKKKGPLGGRNSRRTSSQPPNRLSRQNSIVSFSGITERLQSHLEEVNRPTNSMNSPVNPKSKIEVPPPADEPESLVLPIASPIKICPPKENGHKLDESPMQAFGPISSLNTITSGGDNETDAKRSASTDATCETNAVEKVDSDDRPPMRARRSLSNPPSLQLFASRGSTTADSRKGSMAGPRNVFLPMLPRRSRDASNDSSPNSPSNLASGGASFVNDLPSFPKVLGQSKTQTFDDPQPGLTDSADTEKRFSWLRQRLPIALRRGSSFSSQVGGGSRRESRSLSMNAGSRKASAIIQAVKNLHVRFDSGEKDGDDDTSSEEEATAERDEGVTSLGLEDDEDDVQHFWLAPIWLERNEQVKTVRKSASKTNLQIDASDGNDVFGVEELRGATTALGRVCERFVIHPKSGPRMLWALLGCFLYLYDAIVIPLQFFRLNFPLLRIIRWAVCIYWTIDIPLSFCNGTVGAHGTIELRPEKIVWRYIRSWFFVDVFMVVMDWLQLARDNDSSEWGLIRIRKVARATRIFRLFWSIKLMQTVNLPEQLRIYLLNERFVIIIDIVKIIVAIVGVTHLIACFWYGIGIADQQYSWAAQEEYRDADTEDLYAVSFLWSLSQFTGSLDISMPRNPNERAFSIFVLLFTFVFSAFAISSITSSMTQLQIITAQQSRQFAALRRYLNANSISKALAMRIHRSARNAVEDLAKNTPERSVELLQLVSDPLRQELHYEVHAPALMVHWFFKFYNRVYEHAMRQICHNAVSHLTLHRGDLLFSNGEMPSEEDLRMFFFLSGRLTYSHLDKFPSSVKAGAWACEAAIWTTWPYHGTMRAKADCSLTLLESYKFQKIACQFMSRNVNPVLYGKEFVKSLNFLSRRDLTDLEIFGFNIKEVAQAVFCPEEAAENKRLSDRRTSDASIRGSARAWLPSLHLPSKLSRLTEALDRQSSHGHSVSSHDRLSMLERNKSASQTSQTHLVVPGLRHSQ